MIDLHMKLCSVMAEKKNTGKDMMVKEWIAGRGSQRAVRLYIVNVINGTIRLAY